MREVLNNLTYVLFIKNPLFWTIMILAGISLLYYKKIVGKAGEFWVKKELNKLDKQIYYVINDVTIMENNFTHQIDHIVISPYGIFVIETKQYNGYIKGNEYDKKWIQNNKYYINNPIHQNYGHVKCLEKVLKLSENIFIPIVCIPSTAKINIKSKSHVTRAYDLNETILSYKNNIIQDYEDIYNKIISLNITDKKIKKQHIKAVKQIQKKNRHNLNTCPLCGGALVEKTGRFGIFIGCSNYPKCKYTRNGNRVKKEN